MRFPHGITITVERPTGTGRHGVPTYGAPFTLDGFATAPAGSSESTTGSGSNTVEWDLDLLGPYAADLRSRDRVVLNGDPQPDDERFEVDGEPARYKNPFTGWEAGMVARLKGVNG